MQRNHEPQPVTADEIESILATIHMAKVEGETVEKVPQSSRRPATPEARKAAARLMATLGMKAPAVNAEFAKLGVKGASLQSIYRYLRGQTMNVTTLDVVEIGFEQLAKAHGISPVNADEKDDPKAEDDKSDDELAEDVESAIDRTLSGIHKDVDAVWGTTGQMLAAYLLRRMRRKASKTLPPSNA